MLIEKNKVVSFHYRLSESNEVVEDSRQGEPITYLHGHSGLIKGLENALEGKQAGDHISVTVPPEQGYGERRENSQQRVSINHIVNPTRGKVKYKPGMVVQLNTKNGPQPVEILKVGLKTLDVDTNHPLAGKTLLFDIDVIEVRDATAEELAHGHAHGAGGHAH